MRLGNTCACIAIEEADDVVDDDVEEDDEEAAADCFAGTIGRINIGLWNMLETLIADEKTFDAADAAVDSQFVVAC